MPALKLKLYQGEYRIEIGPGLLGEVGDRLRGMGFKGKAAIIADATVARLYAGRLRSQLEKKDYEVALLEVPPGEGNKSLDQAGRLYTELADFGAERLTPLLALGGGVTGDLAGFVAATYLRGVPLIHLPTTLLAQVDSSIGGKVAVDHGRLKNYVGAFYQPRMVISDFSTLKTLPADQVVNGLAECLKYGLIRDKGLFELIEGNIDEIKALDEGLLGKMILHCASIKAEIVEKDEKDLGLRNILNFGHTAGHALESLSNLAIPHGRAVAMGMMTACLISRRLGVLPDAELARIRSLIQKAGLPVNLPQDLDYAALIQVMQQDKKKQEGALRFILPEAIGKVFIQGGISPLLLAEVLKEQSE
jgi:3-dehydroquinate synthase